MKYDLTLAKIRNTDFASLYDKFIIGEKLSQKQYEILLAIAICFTNADDINVQQLGYRIVVEYCNQTDNYIPLYEIAVNKGLYPVRVYLKTPQRCSILPKSPICCVAFACIPPRSAALMRLASGAFWRISQHF